MFITMSKQKVFKKKKQVKALITSFNTLGNPFKEDSDDILVLDTKEFASTQVVATVNRIGNAGQEQFKVFVEERLLKHKNKVTDVIKLNKFTLFSNPRKSSSKEKLAIASIKAELCPVSNSHIFCKVSQGNLEEFFAYENQGYPSLISKFSNLRLSVKSDLIKYLMILRANPFVTPTVDAMLIDGATILNMLRPSGACKTSDYAN